MCCAEKLLKKKKNLSDFFKVTQVAVKTTDCVCLCVLINFICLTLLYWLKDYRRIGYVCYASHFNRIHLQKVKVLKRLRCIFLFFFDTGSHLYRHEKQTPRPWNLNGIGINAGSPIICELFSWYELSTWAIIQLIWISLSKRDIVDVNEIYEIMFAKHGKQ